MVLKLAGVSYDKVMASPTLRTKIKNSFCKAAQIAFPQAISCECTLSRGSVVGNVTLVFPTLNSMPTGNAASLALREAESELLAEIISIRSELGDAVIGKIEVMRGKLTTSSGTLAVFVRGCDLKKLGFGHCHDAGNGFGPSGRNRQWRWALGDEATGSVEAAKDACCDNEKCSGFNWDREANTYLLYDVVSPDTLELDPPDGERTECWQKVNGTDIDEEPSAASSAAPGWLALFATLALSTLAPRLAAA